MDVAIPITLGAIAAILVLAVVPITATFSYGVGVCGGTFQELPIGASVVVGWYKVTSFNPPVTFVIEEGNQILHQWNTYNNATSGSYKFTSNGELVRYAAWTGDLALCESTAVQVYGHWTGPMIAV